MNYEFKGTKGKIKAVTITQGIAKGMYLSDESQSHFLCEIIENGRSKEENEANLLLFSCAPEMFEMLKRAVNRYYDDTIDSRIFVDEIEQLLKKATTI